MIFAYKGTRLARSQLPEVEDRLGPLPDSLEATVSRDVDGKFELELTYPMNGINVEALQANNWLRCDAGGEKGMEYFRIDQITEEMDGTISLHACHLSYNALAILAAPFQVHNSNDYSSVNYYQWYQALVGRVNQVDSSQMGGFAVVGYTDDLELNAADYSSPVTLKQAALDAIKDREDLYLDYTSFGLRLWKHVGDNIQPSFRIRYGRDMAGYSTSVDFTDFYTHVMPYYMVDDRMVSHGMDVYQLQGLPEEYAGLHRVQGIDLAEYYQGLDHEVDQGILEGIISRWLLEHPWSPLPDEISLETIPQEGNTFELGAKGNIYYTPQKRVVSARIVSLTYDVLEKKITSIGVNKRAKDVTDTIARVARG